MSIGLIAILLLGLAAVIGVLVVLIAIGNGQSIGMGGSSAASENLRNMVRAQRASMKPGEEKKFRAGELAVAAAAESNVTAKKTSSTGKLAIERKLRYAHLPIAASHFYIFRFVVSVIPLIFAALKAPEALQFQLMFLCGVIPWILCNSTLTYLVNRRVDMFDSDYPVLLMSFVSLLKTGMNTITGLEAAAKGLDSTSLVRAEVMLMVERLKLGLTEDQAVNAFGEDIPHPELDLFVQSLLLSRRVGGQLSATLERLARQVRKRQQFRKQAVAAVGMERSSIVFIASIMSGLLGFITYRSPELLLGALEDALGLSIVGWAIVTIVLGFLWSRSVTNIKI